MKQIILNNSQYDGLTTTTSTITTRPIASAAPSPPLSPKRKLQENDELERLISSKKPKMSCTESSVEQAPESPLYKNFGNGLSVCNNTKTNRFANINEVLRYLSFDSPIENKNTTTNCSSDNCVDINEKTLSEDILNEFMEDLHDTKELPELHLNLWDLRDMLRLDFDLL